MARLPIEEAVDRLNTFARKDEWGVRFERNRWLIQAVDKNGAKIEGGFSHYTSAKSWYIGWRKRKVSERRQATRARAARLQAPALHDKWQTETQKPPPGDDEFHVACRERCHYDGMARGKAFTGGRFNSARVLREGDHKYLVTTDGSRLAVVPVLKNTPVGIYTYLDGKPRSLHWEQGYENEARMPSVKELLKLNILTPHEGFLVRVSAIREACSIAKNMGATWRSQCETVWLRRHGDDLFVTAAVFSGSHSPEEHAFRATGDARGQAWRRGASFHLNAMLNRRFLTHVLHGLKGSDVVLVHQEEGAFMPVRFLRPDGERHVVMPMRPPFEPVYEKHEGYLEGVAS